MKVKEKVSTDTQMIKEEADIIFQQEINNWQEHISKMRDDPEYKDEYLTWLAQEEIKDLTDYLNTCAKFIDANDVPQLPKVSERKCDVSQEVWDEFILPKLIEKGAIPKSNLIDGQWYYGDFRNSNFGKWNAKDENFGHWRMKFGWIWDTCNHFQMDRGFALFVPIRLATKDESREQENIGNKGNFIIN